MRTAYLSLGSNLGDRGARLRAGVASVAGDEQHRVSGVYETEPLGGVAQDSFWNIVLELTTASSPHELMGRCQRAEAEAGRTREQRWGPRTLDVDLLLVGELTSDDLDLLLPHPRMWQRRFVLAPLRDVAPAMVSEEIWDRAEGAVRWIGTLDTLR